MTLCKVGWSILTVDHDLRAGGGFHHHGTDPPRYVVIMVRSFLNILNNRNNVGAATNNYIEKQIYIICI